MGAYAIFAQSAMFRKLQRPLQSWVYNALQPDWVPHMTRRLCKCKCCCTYSRTTKALRKCLWYIFTKQLHIWLSFWGAVPMAMHLAGRNTCIYLRSALGVPLAVTIVTCVHHACAFKVIVNYVFSNRCDTSPCDAINTKFVYVQQSRDRGVLITNDCIACVGRDKECSLLLCARASSVCYQFWQIMRTVLHSSILECCGRYCAEKQTRLCIIMSSATDEVNSRWILFVATAASCYYRLIVPLYSLHWCSCCSEQVGAQ